nr:hypothetical protein [uncultured Neisseria sp.]
MESISTTVAAALVVFLLAAIIITVIEILVQQRLNQILEISKRGDDSND